VSENPVRCANTDHAPSSFGRESTRHRERLIIGCKHFRETNSRSEVRVRGRVLPTPFFGAAISAHSSFSTVKAGKLRRQGAFCVARAIFPNFSVLLG
jgi:hypothetical protein